MFSDDHTCNYYDRRKDSKVSKIKDQIHDSNYRLKQVKGSKFFSNMLSEMAEVGSPSQPKDGKLRVNRDKKDIDKKRRPNIMIENPLISVKKTTMKKYAMGLQEKLKTSTSFDWKRVRKLMEQRKTGSKQFFEKDYEEDEELATLLANISKKEEFEKSSHERQDLNKVLPSIESEIIRVSNEKYSHVLDEDMRRFLVECHAKSLRLYNKNRKERLLKEVQNAKMEVFYKRLEENKKAVLTTQKSEAKMSRGASLIFNWHGKPEFQRSLSQATFEEKEERSQAVSTLPNSVPSHPPFSLAAPDFMRRKKEQASEGPNQLGVNPQHMKSESSLRGLVATTKDFFNGIVGSSRSAQLSQGMRITITEPSKGNPNHGMSTMKLTSNPPHTNIVRISFRKPITEMARDLEANRSSDTDEPFYSKKHPQYHSQTSSVHIPGKYSLANLFSPSTTDLQAVGSSPRNNGTDWKYMSYKKRNTKGFIIADMKRLEEEQEVKQSLLNQNTKSDEEMLRILKTRKKDDKMVGDTKSFKFYSQRFK